MLAGLAGEQAVEHFEFAPRQAGQQLLHALRLLLALVVRAGQLDQAINAFTPMARIAEASEIKGSALYLASAASSYTTGLMLVTDGGCMAK